MNKISLLIVLLFLSGCTTYSHLEKADDDEFYLIKNTRILFVISVPSIDKCKADENKNLACE